MTIQTAFFLDATNSTVLVTRNNGRAFSVPASPENRDYRDVLAWVVAGNSIGPFVAPPSPSIGQRRSAIADYFIGNEGRALLLDVLDEATGKPPGKTLADILLKVT